MFYYVLRSNGQLVQSSGRMRIQSSSLSKAALVASETSQIFVVAQNAEIAVPTAFLTNNSKGTLISVQHPATLFRGSLTTVNGLCTEGVEESACMFCGNPIVAILGPAALNKPQVTRNAQPGTVTCPLT